MAIGRISGALLFSDLDRQSVDLAFTTNGKPLTYMDFTNFRFGVNTNSVVDTFTVSGTANVSGITKIFGNLVAASGAQASDVNTGAFNVIGGAGITGNLYAGNLFANNFSGNISNTGGTSIFGNIGVTDTAYFGSLNTANAVISGGYISMLTNATVTTGNFGSLYAATVNSTSANLTTAYATNFSTGNAVISGGYISALTNAYITTSNITNFSTGNAVINGGYIDNLSNATIATGNTASWYATELNSTTANLTTAYSTNLSTGNAVITGGYVSGLANLSATTSVFNNLSTANALITGGSISGIVSANITTANIIAANLGNIKIEKYRKKNRDASVEEMAKEFGVSKAKVAKRVAYLITKGRYPIARAVDQISKEGAKPTDEPVLEVRYKYSWAAGFSNKDKQTSREFCKVTFKTEDGASVSDRFINQESIWWRVNQLVAATDHNVPDGTQVDFAGTKGAYANFLRAMIGLSLVVTLKFEEYQSNGETKRTLRIRNMKQVSAAKPSDNDGGDGDEKPF